MIKKTYKLTGMDCASCATALELDLEDIGIKAKCSFARESLDVEFGKPEEENEILKVVKDSGFSVLDN